MKRWDLIVSRKLDKGGYANTRVGVVFESDRGNLQIKIDPGITIHCAPGVTLNGFVQRPFEGRGPARPQQQQELPKSDADDSEWA